mmetsp:Transcript_42765/g.47810  ORF Transcript_42765/g.47810 Transcript_42765/m.47810 type:complete len:108 (+) Transcript_42765:318-641(+)|eukprot:CAMPEP_0170844510 /NCGR_PEP_ID=MMETSP0734-20130129/6923_1 /TAXON_ID=186038 /ORGANISM="Fragilariopsis kerguelensis, Strain L26-C5" /LENGTH=107 /DNA_ID=CAMNT_0011212937 /DNA_START=302 /DNA_END=625 /DNA_ORIENTATION=-
MVSKNHRGSACIIIQYYDNGTEDDTDDNDDNKKDDPRKKEYFTFFLVCDHKTVKKDEVEEGREHEKKEVQSYSTTVNSWAGPSHKHTHSKDRIGCRSVGRWNNRGDG